MAASAKLYRELAASFKAQLDTASMNTDPYARGARGAVINTARMIATDLANDNPRFDREKFLAACGMTDEAIYV